MIENVLITNFGKQNMVKKKTYYMRSGYFFYGSINILRLFISKNKIKIFLKSFGTSQIIHIRNYPKRFNLCQVCISILMEKILHLNGIPYKRSIELRNSTRIAFKIGRLIQYLKYRWAKDWMPTCFIQWLGYSQWQLVL